VKRVIRISVHCLAAVLVTGLAYSAAVAGYQTFLLSCRPNCAGVDLSGASLYRPYPSADPEMGMISIGMREVDFRGANLSKADLRGVFVRKCNFSQANLSNANLRDTDFAWAGMDGVDLSNANMFRTNLYSVDLTGANLTGANLTNAYMLLADLTGADLTGADLTGAKYDSATKWPEGFDPDQAGAIYLGQSSMERVSTCTH